MAGFQHDHKRRVQLIKLQDIAVRIPAREVRFRTLPPRRKIFILILHERKMVSAERIAMFFCYIQYTRTHKKKKQGKYRKGKAALQFRQGCRCCLPKAGRAAQKGSMQYAAWTMKGSRKRK